MKKLFVASALALALTVAGQQKASAWSEFKLSAGFNLSWACSPCSYNFCFSRQCEPYPGCLGQACFANGGAAYYGGYAAAPGAAPYYGGAAQAPAAQPAAAAQTYNPYYNSGYQPVGYSYAGSPNYQVPAYWYGR